MKQCTRTVSSNGVGNCERGEKEFAFEDVNCQDLFAIQALPLLAWAVPNLFQWPAIPSNQIAARFVAIGVTLKSKLAIFHCQREQLH